LPTPILSFASISISALVLTSTSTLAFTFISIFNKIPLDFNL